MDKLRALQYFIAATEEGSFSGAARRLEVSVPAVGKMINALERAVGATLVERSSRGLVVTADGRAYLDACRPLLEQLDAADSVVSRAGARPRARSSWAHRALSSSTGSCPRCPPSSRAIRTSRWTSA